MPKSIYDLYELVFQLALPPNLPPTISIRMPEIPLSVPNPTKYFLSQLEEVIKRTELREGSSRKYLLMMDLGSYSQLLTRKPENLAEETWLRNFSSRLNKIARHYGLRTLEVLTDKKVKMRPQKSEYQTISVTIFRPAELAKDFQG